MKKYFSAFLTIAAVLLTIACTKDEPKKEETTPEPEKITLAIDSTSVKLAKEANSSTTVGVTTNAASLTFDFGEAETWLNASYDGKGVITITALSTNEDTEVRTATLTVTAAEDVAGTIAITQAATEKQKVESKIGEAYENGSVKGVIFWEDPENPKNVKIVSTVLNGPMNFCTNAAAGGSTVNALAISGTSESDGAANMKAIETFMSTNSIAASEMLAYSICKAEGDGWYVPSKNELIDLVLGYSKGLTFELIEANRSIAGDKPSQWAANLTAGYSGEDAAQVIALYQAAYDARVKMDKALTDLGGSPINNIDESASKTADGTTYLSSTQDTDAVKVGYVTSGGRPRASAAAKYAKSPSRYIRCVRAVTLD